MEKILTMQSIWPGPAVFILKVTNLAGLSTPLDDLLRPQHRSLEFPTAVALKN